MRVLGRVAFAILLFSASAGLSSADTSCDPTQLQICFNSQPSGGLEGQVQFHVGDIGNCVINISFRFRVSLPSEAHQTCSDPGANDCTGEQQHGPVETVGPQVSEAAFGTNGCGCVQDLLYCFPDDAEAGSACSLNMCGGGDHQNMCDTDDDCNKYYGLVDIKNFAGGACDSVTHQSNSILLGSCNGPVPAENGETTCCSFTLGTVTSLTCVAECMNVDPQRP